MILISASSWNFSATAEGIDIVLRDRVNPNAPLMGNAIWGNSAAPDMGGGGGGGSKPPSQTQPTSQIKIPKEEIEQFAMIFSVPKPVVKQVFIDARGDRDAVMRKLEEIQKNPSAAPQVPGSVQAPPAQVPIFDRVNEQGGGSRQRGGTSPRPGGPGAAPGGVGATKLQFGNRASIDKMMGILPQCSRDHCVAALNAAEGDSMKAIEELLLNCPVTSPPQGGGHGASSGGYGGNNESAFAGAGGGGGTSECQATDDLQTVLRRIEEQNKTEGERKMKELKAQFPKCTQKQIDEAMMLTDDNNDQAALYLQNVLGVQRVDPSVQQVAATSSPAGGGYGAPPGNRPSTLR